MRCNDWRRRACEDTPGLYGGGQCGNYNRQAVWLDGGFHDVIARQDSLDSSLGMSGPLLYSL
jgi:hypothetical protein